MSDVLHIRTTAVKEIVDLTDRLETVIRKANLQEGLCSLFVTHTTAALTTGEIGEGTDDDLLVVVEEMIPRIRFQHAHNPAHAWSHMASSLLGTVTDGAGVSGTVGARHVAISDAGRTRRPA